MFFKAMKQEAKELDQGTTRVFWLLPMSFCTEAKAFLLSAMKEELILDQFVIVYFEV